MAKVNLGKVKGADGVTPNIMIEKVEMLDAGAEAYFERDATSPDSSPVFNVGIPRGASGATPSVQAGNTTTLTSGSAAAVTRREGSPDVAPIFDFAIPEGPQGPQGTEPAKSILITESVELGPPHANKQLIVNSTNDVTVLILPATYATMEDYCEIEVFRLGSGTVTIKASDGVTILCKAESYTIPEQYTSAALKLLTAYDSTNNTWALQGAVGE